MNYLFKKEMLINPLKQNYIVNNDNIFKSNGATSIIRINLELHRLLGMISILNFFYANLKIEEE